MKANDVRPGMAVRLDGKLYVITGVEHRTPGNLRAFVQIKIKDIIAAKTVEKRFSSTEEIEAVNLDRRTCEYLYQDGTDFVFMDSEDFEQFNVSADLAGDAMLYLRPNGTCTILFHEGNPISFELPPSVELTVEDCEPGVKGATATNVQKEAVMETGLKTRVPDFITVGENIRISTADGSYQSRAKT